MLLAGTFRLLIQMSKLYLGFNVTVGYSKGFTGRGGAFGTGSVYIF